MAEKDLLLNLKMDKRHAEEASREFFARQKDRRKTDLSDDEVAERAKTQFLRRELKQRVDALAASAKTSVEQARDAAKQEAEAAKQAAKQKTEAAKQAAQAAKQAAREAAEAAKQAAKQEAEAAKQAAAEAARARVESEKRAAVETHRLRLDGQRRFVDMTRDEQREYVRAELAKISAARKTAGDTKSLLNEEHRLKTWMWRDERDALGEREKQYSSVADAIKGGVVQVGSFVAGMAGFSSLTSIVDQFAENWRRLKQNVVDATGVLQDYRRDLLELATLKDRAGRTGEEMADNLRFRALTGQTAAQATQFQMEAIGAGEAAVDTADSKRKISKSEFDAAMIDFAKMQVVHGGSASAYGGTLGLLANLGDERKTAEGLSTEMGALYKIAQPGRFSNTSQAFDQFAKGAGYVKSGVLSPREVMALTSSYSIEEPDAAATRVDQLVRATVGSLGRDKRVRAPEGVDVTGTAEYLKSIGAAVGMKPQQIAAMIKKDVAAKKAAAEGKGEAFDPYVYLQSHGYGNMEDLKSLMNFDTTRWEQTYAPMLRDANLGKGVMADVDDRLGKDASFVGGQAAQAAEIAETTAGLGSEARVTFERAAYARLKSRNGGRDFAGMPKFEEAVNPGIGASIAGAIGIPTPSAAYYASIKEEMSNILEEKAKAVGIDPRRPMRAVGGGGGGASASFVPGTYGDEQADSLANEIMRRGGGDLRGVLQEVADGNRRIIEKLDEGNKDRRAANRPNLAQGAPPTAPARP